MVVDCAQLLYLFEVSLSNHFVQVFISESNVCAPALADKAIDFEGVVCFVIQANAPICSGVKLLRKAQHPVELKVLTLKIKVHHLLNKVISPFEQLHDTLLHLGVKFAEIALDEESIELELHALVRLVPIILQHTLKQIFKIDAHFILISAIICVWIRDHTRKLEPLTHLLA